MRIGETSPPHSHTWLPYITPNGVRLAHEILTNSYSYNQTQGFMGDKNLPMTNKKNCIFSLHCVRFALTLASRKLGYGSERKTKVFLTFVLSFSRLALTLQLQKTKYSEKGLLCEYTCNVYNW